MAEGVEEAVQQRHAGLLRERRRVAVRGEQLADGKVRLVGGDPGADRGDGQVERLLDERVHGDEPLGRVAHDERAREVRMAGGGAVPGGEIHDDRLAGLDRARAEVVRDRGLGAVGDDRIVRGAVVRTDGLRDRRPSARTSRCGGERVAHNLRERRRQLRQRGGSRPARPASYGAAPRSGRRRDEEQTPRARSSSPSWSPKAPGGMTLARRPSQTGSDQLAGDRGPAQPRGAQLVGGIELLVDVHVQPEPVHHLPRPRGRARAAARDVGVETGPGTSSGTACRRSAERTVSP